MKLKDIFSLLCCVYEDSCIYTLLPKCGWIILKGDRWKLFRLTKWSKSNGVFDSLVPTAVRTNSLLHHVKLSVVRGSQGKP